MLARVRLLARQPALRASARRLASTLNKRDITYALESAPNGSLPGPSSAVVPPSQPKHITLKLSRSLLASFALVLSGVGIGIWNPFDLQVAYHPKQGRQNSARPAHVHENEEHSPRQLESELASLPLVTGMRQEAFEKRESDLWHEARPYQVLEPRHAHELVGGNLLGRDKIAIPPWVRERTDGTQSVVVVHVGNDVCGHEGIVHGGLVATLFDQYLARLGFLSLGSRAAATAHLSVNYRAPVRANQFLVFRMVRETPADELKQKPHKVSVVGRLEDINGTLLAEGRAIFVQPRDKQKFFKQASTGAP